MCISSYAYIYNLAVYAERFRNNDAPLTVWVYLVSNIGPQTPFSNKKERKQGSLEIDSWLGQEKYKMSL